MSEIRNFKTPNREKILTNLEHFLQNQCEYIESMPRKESLYHELENLKVHIERGCFSGLPPDGGTENNERLHHYLNRRFLRGASVISPELAGAILMVIFYAYNARSINGKRGKVSWLVSYPSNHSNERNGVVLPESTEAGSSDPDNAKEIEDTKETKGCYERVLSMYNTLISVRNDCDRKGFKVERLLGFHDGGCQNITDYNLQRTLSLFNLLLDPIVKDDDCLFNNVLMQLSKLLFTNSNGKFSSHIAALDLLHEDKAIVILKLRFLFCFFDFVRCNLCFELILYQKIILTGFCFSCLWLSGFNPGKSLYFTETVCTGCKENKKFLVRLKQ